MAEDTTNPFGIDRTLYERLGQVTVHWTQMEMILGEFLAYLLRAEPGALYVVTQNIAASTVLDWCRVLCGMKFSNEADQTHLKELFSDIDESRRERNSYVHGLWSKGPEQGTAIIRTVRWDRREVMKDELVTLGDLDSLLKRTNEHFMALVGIGMKLGFRKPFTST